MPCSSGTCKDVGFLHSFPLEKGFASDDTNTSVNGITMEAFITTVLRDRTNIHLEANIVVSVPGACDSSAGNPNEASPKYLV